MVYQFNSIEEKFKYYKNIHENTLKNLDEKDNLAKILLERSLFLSVFIEFETFLKKIIDNYVHNIIEDKKRYIDLEDDFLLMKMKNEHHHILKILNDDSNKELESFQSFKKKLTANITPKEIKQYIRFEFLHKEKLDNYYPKLFQEIFGKRDILKEIDIEKEFTTIDLEEKINDNNAEEFIVWYTQEIRNKIAHENNLEEFSTKYGDFNKILENFNKIIKELKSAYFNHTGYLLVEIKENIIDEFM